MKINLSLSLIVLAAFVAIPFQVSTTSAQIVDNGSFNGSRGAVTLATDWSTQAPPPPRASTPDLNSATGNLTTSGTFNWDGTILDSDDGGTFANLFGFTPGLGAPFSENIFQVVDGLSVGQTYNVDFEYALQPITNGNNAPMVSGGVVVDLSSSGTSFQMFSSAEDTTPFSWELGSFSFVAPSDTIRVDLTNFYNSGTTTYVGIDGFSVTAIPEPSSFAVLGLGTMFVLRRRR